MLTNNLNFLFKTIQRTSNNISNLKCFNFKKQYYSVYSPSTPMNNILNEHKSSELIGQPTFETHPHLLSNGEVLKGIPLEEIKERRKKLLSSFPIGSTIVLFSPPEPMMSYDIPWQFRQNTNFLYYSGCQEPESIIVMEKISDNENKVGMYVRPKIKEREIWEGPRCGPKNAISRFSLDFAKNINEFVDDFKLNSSNKNSTVFINQPEKWVSLFHKLRVKNQDIQYQEIESHAQFYRLIKSENEAKMMQDSGDIAGNAFEQVMKYIRPGMNEQEISAYFEFQVKKNGAQRMSYPPVVASGSNGNIIHYVSNNQICNDGDLLLMDAGCEYWNYTSDITRTFPVNGKFSEAQKKIYAAVLDINKKCIELCRSGSSIKNIHRESEKFTIEHLKNLGIINPQKDNVNQRFLKYYPHSIGHYLGMDTHDTIDYDYSLELQPGMIITIEPGIYIDKNDETVLPEYRGIAIRVEDDVLITKDNPIVLTKNAPKEIHHIESIMSRK